MTDGMDSTACELPGTDWHFRVEPSHRWVRVKFGGETIVDSKRAVLAFEAGRFPVYYFPQEDVRMDLLVASDNQTVCSHKGTASYWSIKAGDKISENAAWSYLTPKPVAQDIEGYLSLYWVKQMLGLKKRRKFLSMPVIPIDARMQFQVPVMSKPL